mmetsp:Transcript_11512/g.27322  ORF Transcript_11512/g.27322 Transcript_11512/m.27322 type:complete len:210 (-) Transcript_11512:2002-2631(-)
MWSSTPESPQKTLSRPGRRLGPLEREGRGEGMPRGWLALDGESLQVVVEDAEADIVCHDDLPKGLRGVVGRGGVELGEEEPRLAAPLVAVHEARHREALGEDGFRLLPRRLEQLGERLVLRLELVFRLAPLSDGRAVENNNREVRVQEEDAVRLHGGDIQQHGLRRAVERVRGDLRLDHHHRVADALPQKHEPVVCRLIRAVVKHLNKL